MNQFKQFVSDFSVQNQLKLNTDALHDLEQAQTGFEVCSSLYACWNENGVVDDAEAGCGASALLRPVINNFLNLMGRNNWHIESVIVDSEEENAQCVLENDTSLQQVAFEFDDLCGDWVLASVLQKLQQFTHEQGQKTVAIYSSEDALFLMLPLAHEAYSQLQIEIEKLQLK